MGSGRTKKIKGVIIFFSHYVVVVIFFCSPFLLRPAPRRHVHVQLVSEHGSGVVRAGVWRPALRRLQLARPQGQGVVGKVQDTFLHVIR